MQQKQNRGDKGAGMTDPDPPDEIRDRETPCDRNVHAPNADAFQQQPRDREEKHHQERECDREAEDPTVSSGRVRTTSVIFFVTDALSYPGATTGSSSARVHAHLRVGIAQLRQIRRARARVQFREQAVVQRRGAQFRDAAAGVVDVAEDDRLRRTRLRARGRDLAVADRAIRFVRVDLHRVDRAGCSRCISPSRRGCAR